MAVFALRSEQSMAMKIIMHQKHVSSSQTAGQSVQAREPVRGNHISVVSKKKASTSCPSDKHDKTVTIAVGLGSMSTPDVLQCFSKDPHFR